MLLRSITLIVLVLSSLLDKALVQGTKDKVWWAPQSQNQLPDCPGALEERHYNIDVQVDNLPDACSDQQLMVIGWLIEDAIQDMEEHMPEYQGEDWLTALCPLPDKGTVQQRALSRILSEKASLRRGLQRRRYTYRGSGTCRRCRKQTRRYLATGITSDSICSVAETVSLERDLAKEVAMTSANVLVDVVQASRGLLGVKERVHAIIEKANEANSKCQKASSLARTLADEAMRVCKRARNEPDFHVMRKLMRQVEGFVTKAADAVKSAEEALVEVEQAKTDMNRDSLQDHRDLKSFENFGVSELVLIDADKGKEIKKAFECDPINKCWGSANKFDIEAKVFGKEVEEVEIQLDGPIERKIVASKEPYELWGGNGAQLPPGEYKLKAKSLNKDGDKGIEIKIEFTVDDSGSSQQSPDSSQQSPDSSQQSSASSNESFGVNGIVLVDARRNRDIPGAIDCEPINKCYGSSTKFNMRANVFGDVDEVKLSIRGPVSNDITEGIPPYSVLGDSGNGDYYERDLPDGDYVVTARAYNRRGAESSVFRKEFTVRSNSQPVPTSKPPNSSRGESFGVSDLVMVNADSKKDIPGAIDCRPFINDCIGSADSFNIRADTFGDVEAVYLNLEGPIRESRTEWIFPYAVFSDDGHGDYNGKELPPGDYTITARARNDDSEVSKELTKHFTVAAKGRRPPTPSPTPPPIDPAVIQGSYGRRGDDFLERVVKEKDSSPVDCAAMEEALSDKAVADSSVTLADESLEWVLEMGSGFPGILDVRNISSFAEDAHLDVLDASKSAGLAVSLVESYCQVAERAKKRGRTENYLEIAHEAAKVVASSAASARNGLFNLRQAQNEMKELTAILKYDVGTGDIEQELMDEGKVIMEQIDTVLADMDEVDKEIEQTSDKNRIVSLARQRETLEKDEVQLEDLLTTNQEILKEQTDLKKEIFTEDLRPDFNFEDPLKYIVHAIGTKLFRAASWDRASETTDSKEAWFGKFGDLVVEEIPRRLKLVYNKNMGGCITDDTILEVLIQLEEVPWWELLNPFECFEDSLIPEQSGFS